MIFKLRSLYLIRRCQPLSIREWRNSYQSPRWCKRRALERHRGFCSEAFLVCWDIGWTRVLSSGNRLLVVVCTTKIEHQTNQKHIIFLKSHWRWDKLTRHLSLPAKTATKVVWPLSLSRTAQKLVATFCPSERYSQEPCADRLHLVDFHARCHFKFSALMLLQRWGKLLRFHHTIEFSDVFWPLDTWTMIYDVVFGFDCPQGPILSWDQGWDAVITQRMKRTTWFCHLSNFQTLCELFVFPNSLYGRTSMFSGKAIWSGFWEKE